MSSGKVVDLLQRGSEQTRVCRPAIGLHVVGNNTGRELSHVPKTQLVLVQSCAYCGIELNRVSKHKGMMLPGGMHVLVHWVWPLKLVLGLKDVQRLVSLPEHQAMTHLSQKVWGGLHFADPPDLSRHPASITQRVVVDPRE